MNITPSLRETASLMQGPLTVKSIWGKRVIYIVYFINFIIDKNKMSLQKRGLVSYPEASMDFFWQKFSTSWKNSVEKMLRIQPIP